MNDMENLRKAKQWLSHRYGAGIADEEDEQALDLFSDLLAAELKRQNAIDKNVNRAIKVLEIDKATAEAALIVVSQKKVSSSDLELRMKISYLKLALESYDLAIDALKRYKPEIETFSRKRYKIDYGSGIAYLYTPHENWEERFKTLAYQCFGIRKSIEYVKLVEVTDKKSPYLMDGECERLVYGGDVVAWKSDGERIETEFDE